MCEGWVLYHGAPLSIMLLSLPNIENIINGSFTIKSVVTIRVVYQQDKIKIKDKLCWAKY